jgi:hypothetical protein
MNRKDVLSSTYSVIRSLAEGNSRSCEAAGSIRCKGLMFLQGEGSNLCGGIVLHLRALACFVILTSTFNPISSVRNCMLTSQG